MKINSIISKLSDFLQSSEMFARPSQQIPGKWDLYEYYTENESDLKHVKEEFLNSENLFWNMEFLDDEKYMADSNLSLTIISSIEKGTWSISKNFITLEHPEDSKKNVEFQFAIEKENLKILKKDTLGKIDFFGFFRRRNSQ